MLEIEVSYAIKASHAKEIDEINKEKGLKIKISDFC